MERDVRRGMLYEGIFMSREVSRSTGAPAFFSVRSVQYLTLIRQVNPDIYLYDFFLKIWLEGL